VTLRTSPGGMLPLLLRGAGGSGPKSGELELEVASARAGLPRSTGSRSNPSFALRAQRQVASGYRTLRYHSEPRSLSLRLVALPEARPGWQPESHFKFPSQLPTLAVPVERRQRRASRAARHGGQGPGRFALKGTSYSEGLSRQPEAGQGRPLPCDWQGSTTSDWLFKMAFHALDSPGTLRTATAQEPWRIALIR
jgi:hypothetical protein